MHNENSESSSYLISYCDFLLRACLYSCHHPLPSRPVLPPPQALCVLLPVPDAMSQAATSTPDGPSKRRGSSPPPSDSQKRHRSSKLIDSPSHRETPPQTRAENPPPKLVTPTFSTSSRSLACPFYKNDPIQHQACAHASLSKISYVKQHLFRRHAPSIHCPRCFENFEDHQTLEEHSRQEPPCAVRNERPQHLHGMTNEQFRKLKTRADPKRSEEAQWADIWNVFFPRLPLPVSIHIELDLPEEVDHLREHMAQIIPPGVIAELDLNGTEDLSRRLTGVVLRVTDQWIKKRRESQAGI